MVKLLDSQVWLSYPLHPLQPWPNLPTSGRPQSRKESWGPRHKTRAQGSTGGGVRPQSPPGPCITQLLRPQLLNGRREMCRLLRVPACDPGKPEHGWFPSRSPQGGEGTSPPGGGSSSLISSRIIPCCIRKPHFWMFPFLTHNDGHSQAMAGCSHQGAAQKLPEHQGASYQENSTEPCSGACADGVERAEPGTPKAVTVVTRQ